MNRLSPPTPADTSPNPAQEAAKVPFAPFPRLARFLLVLCAATGLLAAVATAASAAEPKLRVTSLTPEHVTPGESVKWWIAVHNVGDAPMSGTLTIRYDFPEKVKVVDPVAEVGPAPLCTQAGSEVECTIEVEGMPPGRIVPLFTESQVDAGAEGLLAGEIEVSGGGTPIAVTVPLAFDTTLVGPFALHDLDVALTPGELNPAEQAAAHPASITTGFRTNAYATANFKFPAQGTVTPPESVRDVITHVPAGLVGDPTATASRCTAAELAQKFSGAAQVPNCPRDSQIGVALVNAKDIVPVYNLVPALGSPAMFGFVYQGLVVTLRARLRPSDYGVDIVALNSPSSVPVTAVELTLWGSPADSSHDTERAECTEGLFGATGQPCPAFTQRRSAFLRLPTSCPNAPLPWQIEVDSYQQPGVFRSRSTTSPAPIGCDRVPFDPDISLAPTDSSSHSTSGLDFELTVPQDSGPDGISQADVRRASLALPQGVGLNPAAADGLAACSDAQLRLGLEGPAACPDASKLGTVVVETPLLEEQLDGAVYLRTQASQDPESGEMYRLAIVLHSAERGVDVKLPGSLIVDRDSGRLTTTFADLPQLPFESMQLHLKSGPRAPLTTPAACGSYAAEAVLEGWNGKTRTLRPQLEIDQDCAPAQFRPGFEAGVANPRAGAFSPFSLRITRDSGMPNLSRISATLPDGELARLAGVPLCPDPAAATGACPAASRIGHVVTAVGEGSAPIYLPRPDKAPTAVYLAGPYHGAPYSILAAVPAQSGPFDLGTVTVRSALRIDPDTARASVTSDPLPQIFGGIPIAYRDVRVEVDRPAFSLNPTDCEPLTTDASIASIGGESAALSDRFQLSDCAALRFRPRLSLRFKGAVHRRAHPKLIATLRAKPGEANIARAQVKLPKAAFLDNGSIGDICTRVQFAADTCPPDSVYGRARALSPLLDFPLAGNVYLRSSSHKLPDLVADLRGPGPNPIQIVLAGRTDSVKGALRNTFLSVPDAPVSRFRLELFGGKDGLVEMGDGFCRRPRATVRLDGQSGRIYDTNPKVRASCGRKGDSAGVRRRPDEAPAA